MLHDSGVAGQTVKPATPSVARFLRIAPGTKKPYGRHEMRKNLIALALVGLFSAPCTSQAISADQPVAPVSKMFSAVDLNTETIFAGNGNIVLRAGEQKFVLVFEKTFYMDDAQKVQRWEGYLASDKNLRRLLSGVCPGTSQA